MFNAKQFEKIPLKALKTITRGLKGSQELIRNVFLNMYSSQSQGQCQKNIHIGKYWKVFEYPNIGRTLVETWHRLLPPVSAPHCSPLTPPDTQLFSPMDTIGLVYTALTFRNNLLYAMLSVLFVKSSFVHYLHYIIVPN